MKLINIGFGNMVSASRLIAIVSPESAPIKRIIREAFRLNQTQLAQGHDYVAIARASSVEKKSTDMEKSLLYVCRKLGLCPPRDA